MCLKYRLRAHKVEDPPRVVVYPFLNLGHLLVSEILEARTLRSEAPDHFCFMFFIWCRARMRCTGGNSRTLSSFLLREGSSAPCPRSRQTRFHVAGDTFENNRKHFTVTSFQIVESTHNAGGAFVHELPHDFLPAHAFAEYEQYLFTWTGAHYGVHLPVSEGFPAIDFLRAFFYAFTLRRSGCLLYGMIALSFCWV